MRHVLYVIHQQQHRVVPRLADMLFLGAVSYISHPLPVHILEEVG